METLQPEDSCTWEACEDFCDDGHIYGPCDPEFCPYGDCAYYGPCDCKHHVV